MTLDSQNLTGTFSRETLASAIQFAANSRNPGRFEIASGFRRATLSLAAGTVVAAECVAERRELLGEEAIVEVLSWRFGEFALIPDATAASTQKGRVQRPVDAMLLAASVKRDTLDSEIKSELVRPDAIPVLIPTTTSVQLDPNVWTLIPKIDGTRNVAQIS